MELYRRARPAKEARVIEARFGRRLSRARARARMRVIFRHGKRALTIDK